MSDDMDVALRTLSKAREDFAPDLDEQLLRSIYAIQKRFQFEHDRVTPTRLMDELINEYIDAVLQMQLEGHPR